MPCVSTKRIVTVHYFLFNLNIGARSAPCSFKFEGSKGTISFRRSGSITDCNWLITAPVNHSISLTFATFELYYEVGDVEKKEVANQLKVWDGKNENATFLGSFRGTKRPFSLHSSSRSLLLRLIVDKDVPLCNFEGSYIATTTKGTV